MAAAIGDALNFSTWRSLMRDHKLDLEEAVGLMTALAERADAACSSKESTARRHVNSGVVRGQVDR